MENRMTKIFKITMVIFAVLMLGMAGIFATTVSAEGTDDVAYIELSEYKTYVFTPEGYSVDDGEVTPHTGSYFLYGNANQDIAFRSNNGEAVTL